MLVSLVCRAVNCRWWKLYRVPGTTGNALGLMSGAWKAAARTSPAPVFGFSVGVGVREATRRARGMIGSGSMNGLVGGLAVWLPGTQFWFVPVLLLAPELAFPVIDGSTCPQARALKPCLATNAPPAVSRPILNRSRRLVRAAAMISRRFLAALHISFQRRRETFSPKTL